MWRPMIYGFVMWAVSIYAFRRGGWAEKLAASGIILNSYLSVLLLSPGSKRYQHLESSVAWVDLGLFILLLSITLASRKFWPLWLSAFQGVTVLGHLAPYVHAAPWVYQRAIASWSWLALFVLIIGVRRHSLGVDRRHAAISSIPTS